MAGQASSVQRVLALLLEQERPVTRPDIARALALSRPTVCTAVDRLETTHLVEQVGQLSGRPGRSAALYEIGRSAGLLGAIDIGGSNVRVAVTDARGRLLGEDRQATAAGGAWPIVKQVALMLSGVLDAVKDGGVLRTIAVSVPGVVGPDESTVHFASNIDQPTPFDFRSPLTDELGVDVTLENNVNLAAMAEQWQGVGRDLRTFAVVSVGAGVGAGIVHDGRILRGAHRAAGEVAFLPSHGCRRLETTGHDEAGGLSLLEHARQQPGWDDRPPPTVEELFRRAAAGIEPAVALVEDECQRIATLNAALCAIVDPQIIVMTGGVGANEQLIKRVRDLTADMAAFPPSVIGSKLGERASLIGAVRLASQTAKARLLSTVDG